MPLPLFLIVGAILAGGTGVGLGVKGGIDTADANDKLKKAQKRHDSNMARLKRINESACFHMDNLGEVELKTLSSFKKFSDIFTKIDNKPEFADIKLDGIKIPAFKPKELEKASVGASVLVGGLGGAALGTAGGFAASGATTSAVMALGAASTGSAISSLSGAAATNATLAAIGGGSLAAGGGGMAAGTMILGGATLGVGLLVGGIIFSITGSSLSSKADKAWQDMLDNENKINNICQYLTSLRENAREYTITFNKVRELHLIELYKMENIVRKHSNKSSISWNSLSQHERTIIQNNVMLVGILYEMCKVKFVKKVEGTEENTVNYRDINNARQNAESVLQKRNDQ